MFLGQFVMNGNQQSKINNYQFAGGTALLTSGGVARSNPA